MIKRKSLILIILQTYKTDYPVYKIIKSYEEILELMQDIKDNNEILYFFYLWRKDIDDILYEQEKIIPIKFLPIDNQFAYYFYLSLNISEDMTLINYTYDIKLIENLNEYISDEKIGNIRQLFLGKILIFLVEDYKELDEYDEQIDDEKLKQFEINSQNIIKKNLQIFNKEFDFEYNCDTLLDINIDELLVDVIIYFIKEKKFNNYDYIVNIFLQLDLNKIYLSNNMIEKIVKELENNNCVEYYLIEKHEDLLNPNKINFVYLLIIYIIKLPIYIYQIQFLIKTRKTILDFLRKKTLIYDNADKELKDKIKHILSFILDSEYYIKQLHNEDIEKLNVVLKFLIEFYPEQKKEEIKEIEELIKNNGKFNQKFSKVLEKSEKVKERMPIIQFYNDEYSKKDNQKPKEGIKGEYLEKWETLEQMLKDKKIQKMKKNDKQILLKFLENEENKEVFLHIFDKEVLENFLNKAKK